MGLEARNAVKRLRRGLPRPSEAETASHEGPSNAATLCGSLPSLLRLPLLPLGRRNTEVGAIQVLPVKGYWPATACVPKYSASALNARHWAGAMANNDMSETREDTLGSLERKTKGQELPRHCNKELYNTSRVG